MSEVRRTMKVVAFITDYQGVDRIIDHLELMFVAEKPPPPRVAFQECQVGAETAADISYDLLLARKQKSG